MKIWLVSIFIFSCSGAFAESQPRETPVADFTLEDIDGKKISLYGGTNKGVALIAFATGCPIMQKSVPTVRAIEQKFRQKGVAVFFLLVNANEDLAALKKELQAYEISHIPFLKDPGKTVASRFNFKRTAEAVLIDTGKKALAYQGAIVDRFGYGTVKVNQGNPFLERAIEAMLKGEKADPMYTEAKGCLISF